MKYPLFLPLLLSYQLFAESFPAKFAHFFIAKEENIEFLIAGESKGKIIRASVTHDSFNLINTDENLAKLRGYLQEKNLTPQSISDIENALLLGITDVPSCEGVIELCVPEDIPGQAEYVFDIDAKRLKAFISSDLLMTKTTELEYHNHVSKQNALINSANLYAYADKNDARFTWNNDIVLGLPIGHFSLDTQYRSEGNAFDLYKALYDLEIENMRAIVGYQEFNRISLNSTDFLGYGTNLSGTAITLGSSQNLLKGGSQTQQRIYFFAPEAGQLEVYRGERLLINRNISSGQQFISYDDLPSGVYNITLVIRRGNDELLREQRPVVNNRKFSLPTKSWDYRFEVGYLDKTNTQAQLNDDLRFYWRGALAYRPTESLLLASALMSNKDSSAIQIGSNWSPYERFNLQYTSTFFEEGANHQQAQISLSPFNFTLRRGEIFAAKDKLSGLLFEEEDFFEWGVGVSKSLFGGSAFINYFDYKYTGDDNLGQDYRSLTTSWSRELFGGSFSSSISYNKLQDNEDDWSASLSWSYSFNEKLSIRFSSYNNKDDTNYFQSNLSYLKEEENWQANASAGVQIGSQTRSELSSSLSGRSDYFRYDAFGYINDEGDRSISGSISGTQIVSKTGIDTTYDTGRAFVTVHPTQKTGTTKVNYQLIRNNNPEQSGAVQANDSKTFPIPPYNEIAMYLEADAGNAELNYDDNKLFILPGMHYEVQTKVTPLESQIVILSDNDGEPVDYVQCANEGCRNVEMLSKDGVYRVNYLAGEAFSLTAQGLTCLYDPFALGQEYLTSSCLTDVQIAELEQNKIKEEQLIASNASKQLISKKRISKQQLEQYMVRISEIQTKLAQEIENRFELDRFERNSGSNLNNFAIALEQASEKRISELELKKHMARMDEIRQQLKKTVYKDFQ